jgi:glycerate dehydrogenase
MNIVVIDGYPLNPHDLSWKPLAELGDLEVYDYSSPEQIVERAKNAEVILVNKALITKEIIEKLPKLKLISVMATGYNNLDLPAIRERGIIVCNARAYAPHTVAQHTFALLLELTNHVGIHDKSVREGDWGKQPHFAYTLQTMTELQGKTFGIFGWGNIGQKVGEIAHAFGMEVLVWNRSIKNLPNWARQVSENDIIENSDVISLHLMLTPENKEMVNETFLGKMKKNAFLLNTSRGGLVKEMALLKALQNQEIAGAGLDVLSIEPPTQGNILFDAPRCIITPHNAWMSKEARQRLLDIMVENIRKFKEGKPQNIV